MLQKLFSPKSIAIIGASRTPGKLGHDVLLNVKKFGYTGKIYPVNPKAEEILGLKSYAEVSDIKAAIDLAVIMVPAKYVAEVLRECGKKKVPFALVISAGFKEVGGVGEKREEELLEIAKKYGIRIVGPNCLGLINPFVGLNASFAVGMPARGNIGLISQSGAMGVAILDWSYQTKLGISKMISIGNKSDIDEVDCLEYLARDKDTKVIMMYSESIEKGRDFMRVAASVSLKKPVIVLKAGASEKVQRAIHSHTGALVGSEEAVQAAFEKAGIIRAETVEDFFDYGLAFSLMPVPKGGRIAIVTNAGGPGIMAVAAAEKASFDMPEIKGALRKKLQGKLPASASVKNPIDVIGDAPPERYEHALQSVLSSKEIDGVIVILTPQIMTDEDETARIIARLQKQYKKPVVASFMGGQDVNTGRMILQFHGIPNYETPASAVHAMDELVKFRTNEAYLVPPVKKKNICDLPSASGHPQIRTQEAMAILQKYNLPVIDAELIETPEDCEHIKEFPIVMKIASRDIIHKAASNGVVLNIKDAAAAKKAFRQIAKSIKKKFPKAEIQGMLVQKQLPRTMKAKEVIIGMKRDEAFGAVILFGLGGTMVEYFHDTTYGIAPLTKKEAVQMIQGIKTAALLRDNDTEAAARAIVAVSKLACDYPEIQELDINPMILEKKGKGGFIVDTRMMTSC
ncbi:MAG: acetate--CoA ligase alpha subunit [Candidatus Kerfeldbacteria bacterium]